MLCKRRISIPHKNDIGLTKKKFKLNQTNKTTTKTSQKNKSVFYIFLVFRITSIFGRMTSIYSPVNNLWFKYVRKTYYLKYDFRRSP